MNPGCSGEVLEKKQRKLTKFIIEFVKKNSKDSYA